MVENFWKNTGIDFIFDLIQSPLVIVYLVIVEFLVIVDKSWMTDYLLSKFSRNSGFLMISLNS